MPELPEVETVRRDLEARIVGRRITSCRISPDAPRLVQLVTPAEFCHQLTGRAVAGLRRRGKYLIVDLDDGRAWVLHRRMSGNVLYRVPSDPPDDYTRAVFALDDGHELRWTDLRKFGTMWLVEDATMVMETLGPEPLDAEFTPQVLRERAGKRSAPDQVRPARPDRARRHGQPLHDEALHYAKLHPLRPANKLKPDDWLRLHAGIIEALRMGIAARGSSLGTTLRDHINVDGAPGRNQETVRAYGREAQPCYECGTAMRRIKVGGRSSVFCPQLPARSARRRRARDDAQARPQAAPPRPPRSRCFGPQPVARPHLGTSAWSFFPSSP